jgi:hypothetical protein
MQYNEDAEDGRREMHKKSIKLMRAQRSPRVSGTWCIVDWNKLKMDKLYKKIVLTYKTWSMYWSALYVIQLSS